MDMDENISQAASGAIVCNGLGLDFVEQNGKYAYSEFFREGDWPDEYYEDDELSSMYPGIRLMMISGGWCENFSDLIQTIPHHSIFKFINKILEKEDTLLSFIIRLKNGEGVRRFESLVLNERLDEDDEVNDHDEDIYEEEIDNPWGYIHNDDGDNPWD
jgi:hypothetical protein